MRLYLLNIEQIFSCLHVFLLHIIFDMQHILWVFFKTFATKSKVKIISSITLLEICLGSVCGILSYYFCAKNHCQKGKCLMDAWKSSNMAFTKSCNFCIILSRKFWYLSIYGKLLYFIISKTMLELTCNDCCNLHPSNRDIKQIEVEIFNFIKKYLKLLESSDSKS